MRTSDLPTQAEPKVEQVNIRLTQAEYDDVLLVCGTDRINKTELVRISAVRAIQARARAIREAIESRIPPAELAEHAADVDQVAHGAAKVQRG